MGKTSAPTFDDVRAEYTGLWSSIKIRPEHRVELEKTARKLVEARVRYTDVSKATGVPWYVIGIIHQMECSMNWGQHLHNGDSLHARTHQVPANRPAKGNPPFSWDASAIDALTMPGKEFHKITDWSIERIAYCFELYNGFGYRLVRRIHSPYLWSYSTAYTSGKYVSDGVWSPVAVSEQPGALALLKVMMEMDDSIDCTSCGGNRSGWARAHDDATTVSEAQKPPSAFMTATKSPTVWSIIVAFFTGIWNAFERIVDFVGDLFGSLGDIQVDAESAAAPIQSIFGMLKTDAAYIGTAITVGCLLFAIIRHVQSKRGTA